MSARTPFFSSGARPESRASGNQQESTAGQFSTDDSNIVRQDALTDVIPEETDINNVDNKSLTENDAKDTQYKPFNVNGLIRSRIHSKPPQRILINEGDISQPGAADPNVFSMNAAVIAAPTPFKASKVAPPFLTNMSNATISSRSISPFNFKTPAIPSILPHGDNNAHIHTEIHNSSHGADGPVRIRSVNGFGGGGNVPGRIPDDNHTDDPIHGLVAKQSRSGKRRNDETGTSGQTDQRQKHLKRFKSDNSHRRDTRVEKSGSEFSRGTDLASNYRLAPENHPSAAYSETSDNFTYQGTETMNAGQNFAECGGALDRLLGRDINAYTEVHLLEKYEQAVKRWRECSLEEWYAGAEEIMSKYSKILEFVKERMKAKISLYASFDKKIEQHEALLAGREEMLSGIQAQLVKESESVLGRSLGI